MGYKCNYSRRAFACTKPKSSFRAAQDCNNGKLSIKISHSSLTICFIKFVNYITDYRVVNCIEYVCCPFRGCATLELTFPRTRLIKMRQTRRSAGVESVKWNRVYGGYVRTCKRCDWTRRAPTRGSTNGCESGLKYRMRGVDKLSVIDEK